MKFLEYNKQGIYKANTNKQIRGNDPSVQRSIISNVTEPEDNLLVFFIKQNHSRSLRQAFATQGEGESEGEGGGGGEGEGEGEGGSDNDTDGFCTSLISSLSCKDKGESEGPKVRSRE